MNDIKLTVDIDPEDRYQKAEKDLLQAKKSFSKLTPQEQQKLICELFEGDSYTLILKQIRRQWPLTIRYGHGWLNNTFRCRSTGR